jgi:hypothetical protein
LHELLLVGDRRLRLLVLSRHAVELVPAEEEHHTRGARPVSDRICGSTVQLLESVITNGLLFLRESGIILRLYDAYKDD